MVNSWLCAGKHIYCKAPKYLIFPIFINYDVSNIQIIDNDLLLITSKSLLAEMQTGPP